MPWGPHHTKFIAFSLKGTIFFGITHRPKTKARDVLSHNSYKSLEVRTHENFVTDLPPAVRVTITPLLPSTPLNLPSLHDLSQLLLSTSLAEGTEATLTTPRPYQIQSYLTALHQNSICVLPTGCGKTLIAALLITQLKKMNQTHIALFIVDRVPLVFQQSHVLATETNLRVCPLCGETKSQSKVRELNDGRYDILVATAGCFWELALRKEVDGRQFCAVVFDECHHSKREHVYVKILDWLRGSGGAAPRILGLTASPVGGKTHPQMVKRLVEMSRLFHDSVIFAPEIPTNSVKVTWVKMTRDAHQDRFSLDVKKRLQEIAEDASQYLPGRLNVFSSDLVLSLDELLQPSTLGRLRGLAKRLSEDSYTEPSSPIHHLLAKMNRLFFCLELADVLGVKQALLLLSSPIRSQEASPLLPTTTLHASKYPNDHISPRLKYLTSTLLQNTDKRILIIVHTRATARDLTIYLQSHTTISSTFHPLKIVGHGGYDGMTWTDEQSAVLGMFRRGESRLVVSTSVLEEGLDVPECDLVIRLQGVTSLIGFVQSRGRARKEDSRMMVVVNEWEKRKADEMREQEALARMAIRTMSKEGAVEEYTRRFTHKHDCKQAIKKKKEWNLNPVVTLRVWIPNLEISHLRRCANLEIGDNADEIELVECALTQSFEKAGLSAIRVFRLDKITHDVGVDRVFDSALGYLVGIADITCLSEEGDLLMDGQAVTSCQMLIRDSWHYKVNNMPVWVTPSVGECNEIKNEESFVGCECSLGIWDDCSTFTKRYRIDDVNLVIFEAQGDIRITYDNYNRWIHISRIIIQDFILIDWKGHGTGNVNLFLPLGTAPTCYCKDCYCKDHRNCNINDPVLQNLGMSNVLCITFPSHTIQSKISKLRHSHLTHSVFDTRITIFDGMHDAHHDEYTIDGKNYHENPLPTFTSSQGETRDAHWLLLVLFSLRKGCFTPKVKTFFASFMIEKINAVPLGELTPTRMQMSGKPIHAIIHALTCCQTVRYWSNVATLFNSSYRIFIQTTSNCDVATYALATHRSSTKMRQNEYKIYSVVLTPTRIIYLPLQYTQGSRLFKKFGSSSFITVTFRDEQNNTLRGEKLLTYVQSYIAKGVILAGRLCCFFSATSNQLRTQKATFVDVGFLPGGGDSNADVARGLRAMREQIVQPDGEGVTMAKYLSRLALFGTTCHPTVDVLRSDVIESPDVMTSPHYGGFPTALTDGAGKISRTLGREITSCLDLNAIPSAFQIRWAGAKGVVVVVDDDDVELKGRKMLVRPSMLKFRMGNIEDWTLGVVSHSRWLESHLNREIITLLTSVRDEGYVPEGHIYRLQEEELKIAYRLFTDQDVALRELDGELNQFTKETLKLMKDVGVPLAENPFFVGLLRTHYRNRIRMIVDKTRIPFRQGSLLMGIPDPIGILKEGEVYVSIDPDENTSIGEFRSLSVKNDDGIYNKKIILNQDVTIWRNPCLHPGDVRTVKAVSYLGLNKWKNVVIFPNKNSLKHNIPLECSGGDLDGDLYYVLWDKTITQPFRCNVPPLNYESFGIAPHEQAQLIKKTFFDNAHLSTFVHDVYSNDTLGQVATMHLALCDVQKLGARDETAMELAKAQSYAVDFPKTGVPPEVPIKAAEILKREGYPDFMRRHNCYTSSKPLGHCYRRAASFDVNYQHNTTFNLNGIKVKESPNMLYCETMEKCLNIPGSSTFTFDAQSACKAYVLALNRIRMSYGLRTESEVFLGRGTHWHPYISNRGNASCSIRENLESLQRDFRLLFRQSCPLEEDAEKVASAWFQAARKNECLSLELIVANEVYGVIYPRIASRLSGGGIYPTTRMANAICCYFQETKLNEHVLSLAEPKLAALELLQSVFVEDGKNTYVAQPFGSFALGFLDHDSDIDIVVFVNPTHPDHRCIDLQQNIKTKQSYFLDKISPLIEDHVENKVVVLSARVPIIRCSMPSSFQSTEKISIDIVCDTSGFLKSLWLHELFQKRKDLYVAFLVLTLWARAAGFVKKDTFQKCVIDFRLLTMGEFHVTVLAILRGELNDSFKPMVASRDFVLDLFLNVDRQRQNSHAYKALVDIIDTRDEKILGSAAHLIVTFFERINNICQQEIVQPITFAWKDYLPLVDTVAVPSETVSPECIRKLELHTAPSLHCLLSHSDISFFLEVAAGETEIVSLTRKLPLSLSYRVSGAIPFHEQRFSMISGAEVTLQEQDRNASVLLTAKGSRRSIQILKEELNKCMNMSRWGCRSWVQSSRYFMEDSSFLVMNGVDDISTNVKFMPNSMLQQVRKLGSHNEVSVVAVHNTQNIGETDYSKLNNVDCLLPVKSLAASLRRQVAKMPDKNRFKWISFTASFGSFVALNMSDSLPETSITLSIDELLQGMNKNGRKRKNWERKELNAAKYTTDHTRTENMKKKKLAKTQPSVPRLDQRAKVINKKTQRVGIRTTFFPSFTCLHKKDDLKCAYHSALINSGFAYQRETTENQVQISSALTRGFEVQLILNRDSSNNFRVESAVERSLNWIHGTILGSEVVPDARIRLQTTNSISEAMQNLALPRGHVPIVLRPDGTMDFNEHLTEDEKRKVVYVRHLLKIAHYGKNVCLKSPCELYTSINARIALVREYVRIEDGTMVGPSERCELRLEFDHDLLFKRGINFEELARVIVYAINELTNALKTQGVL